MLYLKFIVAAFLTIALIDSCRPARVGVRSRGENSSSNSYQTTGSDQTAVQTPQTVAGSNENSAPATAFQAVSNEADLSKNYQTAPRRKNIRFPDDCTNIVPAGEDAEWKLQKACAEAVQTALPALPKENCQYETFLKDGSFYDFSRYSSEFHPGAVQFYSLSPNKYLVEVLCQSGAYNVLNAYLLYDESRLPSKARVLEFPSLEFDYDEDSDVAKKIEKVTAKTIGGRYFNPQTKELIVFVKARGIGDAGRYARYSFPNGEPELEEYRAKFKWDGREYQVGDVVKNPPRTWTRYYP